MNLKKTLALILSLVMLFSLAVPAWATETEPTLQDLVNEASGTLTLDRDYTLDERVNVDHDLTINLGGHIVTPTATCANGSAFNVTAGTLKLENGTIDGTNVAEGGENKVAVEDGICLVTVRNGAELVIENDNLTMTINSKNGSCVYPFDGGKVTISGGVFENSTTEAYQYKEGFKGLTLNQANVNTQLIFVTGGTFKGNSPALGDDKGAKFLVEGYEATEKNGVWTVAKAAEKDYVAQIGETKYETLEAAFAAAQDGDTITLLANCAGNGIKAPQGKFTTGLTVDFGGHTYTVDGETVGSTGTETNGFQLLKDNKITFKNGAITSAKAKIMVQNYSDLTLKDMNLSMTNESYSGAYTLSNNNGNVVIDGTTITANTGGGFAFDVCRYSSYPSVHVTVKGDSKINGDVEIFASNSDAKDGFSLKLEGGSMTGKIVVDSSAATAMKATPEKVSVTKATTFEKDAPAGYKWDAEGKLVEATYVAQIGDKQYETLQAAIDSVPANNSEPVTITLLDNVAAGSGLATSSQNADSNPKNIIIDFNKKTYTVKDPAVGSTNTESQAMHWGNGSTIVLKNGTINISDETSDVKMFLQNYANLTIENMVLDATNVDGGTYGTYTGQYAVWSGKKVPIIGFNKGTVTINDGTEIRCADDALINVNLGDGTYSTELTINGGVFGGAFIVEGTSKQTGSFTVKGGTFHSNPAETLSMDDGKNYSFVAEGFDSKPDGNYYVVSAHEHKFTAEEPYWSWTADQSQEFGWSASAKFYCIDDDEVIETKNASVSREDTGSKYIFKAEVSYNDQTYTSTREVDKSFTVTDAATAPEGKTNIAIQGIKNSYSYGDIASLNTGDTKCDWYLSGTEEPVAQGATEYKFVVKSDVSIYAVQSSVQKQIGTAVLKVIRDNTTAKMTVTWSLPKGASLVSATLQYGYVYNGDLYSPKSKAIPIKNLNGTYTLNAKKVAAGWEYGAKAVIVYSLDGEQTTITKDLVKNQF